MCLPNHTRCRVFAPIVAAISLSAVGVAAPTAAARPGGMIRTGSNGVTALGSWRVSTHPRYRAAIHALGSPNGVKATASDTCTGTWGALGLRILFTTFGGGSGCGATLAQSGTIFGASGRQSWRTARGLRVGDSLTRLERLYPGAIKERGARVIVYSLHSVIAEGSRLDIVTAQIKGNRVSNFRLWFGGAGD